MTGDTTLRGFTERALAELEAALPAAVALRHEVHADPRVSGDERDTAVRIARELADIPQGDAPHWITQGFVSRFGGEGPAIAIRAELDALPVTEQSDAPWASTTPLAAHLCGHDIHLAALTAAVRSIVAAGLPVPLVAVLQPREETLPCGAEDFITSGVLDAHDIAAFLGVHVQPQIPDGTFSAAIGTVNASADEFTAVIRGTPSHGAYPQLGHDPIVAAAAVIQSLQHVISRRTDPMSPAVLSIGSIRGGSSFNAIPEEVRMQGTLRAYSQSHRDELQTLVAQVSRHIAAAHGCQADIEIGVGEPPMTNDETLARLVSHRLVATGLEEAPAVRSCGADDFSFYGTRFPSLMVFAGVGAADGADPGLHHPRFLPPDTTVERLARIMIASYTAIAETVLADRHTRS